MPGETWDLGDTYNNKTEEMTIKFMQNNSILILWLSISFASL